jgi:alpha-tubulin suppressor-like RCC1 family protein
MSRPSILAVTALAVLPACGSAVEAPPAPPVPEGPPVAVHIAAGYGDACAVLTDHTTVCWGGRWADTAQRVPALADAATVVTENVTCMVAGGRVACVGDPRDIGLGTTAAPPEDRPSFIPGLTGVVDITAAQATTCARTAGGAVACWGVNDIGEVGDGASPASEPWALSPVQAVGVTTATAIAAGDRHFCALAGDGSVLCWGANGSGQLGDGTTVDRNVPTASGADRAIGLYAGGDTTCALNTSRSALGVDPWFTCWGDLSSLPHGLLGNPDLWPDQSSTPVEIHALQGATQLAIGPQLVCALRAEGTVHCWGRNWNGELGTGTTSSADRGDHGDVVGLVDAVQIAAGTSFACARRRSGEVVCWGLNQAGTLGDGTTIDRATPVAVKW